ncbi:helix-turn-helix domain-containing protein, partial [Nocardioides sp. AX2bis]|uniref:helix-turn-helix domain-containing protein n=1 Tax=Nocardioides sp. AX2bis TaxID=2653157 RepID=UPI0019163F3F
RPGRGPAGPDGVDIADLIAGRERGNHRPDPNARHIRLAGAGTRTIHQLAATTPDSLITTVEAAALLGLRPATIRSWVHRGHLQPTPRTGEHPRRQQMYRLVDIYDAARRR